MAKAEKVLRTYWEIYATSLRSFEGYETAHYVVEPDRWGLADQTGSRSMHSKREVFTSAAQALASHIMRNKNQIASYTQRIERCQEDIRAMEDIAFKKGLLPEVVAHITEYEGRR